MHVRVVMAAIAAGMIGLVGPALSAQTPTPARGVRPRVCAGECPEEKAEMERELARARAELARLATMLSQRGDSLNPAALESVRAELTRAMRAMERLEMRAREQAVRRETIARVQIAQPTISRQGWLGVSFSGTFEIMERPGQPRLFRFAAYPVVESVEPGSPARHAGIEVGDVLLAFKQKDLRKEPIALDELLSPGTRLPVLLRRRSDTRTVTVIVGERPRGTYVRVETPRPPSPAEAPPVVSSVRVPAPVDAPAPPPAPAAPRFWVYSSSETISLAGAELARLPGNLREQVGASGGLLVLGVGHSTPAARAGLREGDVIVSANGAEVRFSGDLQRAIRGARSLSLKVVRQRQPMTLTMEW